MSETKNFTKELMIPNSHLSLFNCDEVYIILKCQCLSRFNSYSPVFMFDKTILKSMTPKIIHSKLDSILKKLVQNNILHKYGNTHYIFNFDEYKLMCDKYTIIYAWEFDLIDKPEILYHYLYILRSRNGNLKIYDEYGKVSMMPITFFANEENIGINTVGRYNKKLEDLKILYVCRNGYSVNRENNIYCRFGDSRYAEALRGTQKQESKEANFLRSVMQRYNFYDTIDDKEQFLKDAIRYNAIMERRGSNKKIDLTELQ